MVGAMIESVSGLEADLRISLKPVTVVLIVLSLALFLWSDSQPDPSQWVPTVLLALLLLAVAGLAWSLSSWRPWMSRWLTILGLTAAIHLAKMWLGIPGVLALTAIPAALAAPMISLSAAAIVAVGESVLLMALHPLSCWRQKYCPDGLCSHPLLFQEKGKEYHAKQGRTRTCILIFHWQLYHIDLLHPASSCDRFSTL